MNFHNRDLPDAGRLAPPGTARALAGERWVQRLVPLFRQKVWRRLPASLRRLVTANLSRVAASAAGHDAALPLCLAGSFNSFHSLGEGARLTCDGFQALGCEMRTIDTTGITAMGTGARRPPRLRMLEEGPGTLLLHFNPAELFLTLPMIGKARTAGKRIIGYWVWELQRIPDYWSAYIERVDEIWTPSHFSAAAIRQLTDKPVRVVPHPVAVRPAGVARRAHFGIAADKHVTLCVYSCATSFERKHPMAAVRAFRQAFGDDARHQLILKIGNSELYPERAHHLRREVAGLGNVRLLDADLGRTEVRDLIASADIVLSLHRSEGFGLVLAEAMLSGVPVVATRWSGNLDFMDDATAALVDAQLVPAVEQMDDYFCFPDLVWAEPDIAQAASWLRRLAADKALVAQMTAKARAQVAERLGAKAFAAAVRPSLGMPEQS